MTSSNNVKGMDYYELLLGWDNPYSTQGFKDNAQISKQNDSITIHIRKINLNRILKNKRLA